MAQFKKMTVAEAVAAVLVQNGIRYAFGVGGHGNTPLLEALYPYHRDGLLRVVDVQHEAVAAYAATALRWVYGIESVVFTSIGPGWFNTLIAQNTAMSNGYGFLVLAGDKTTAYEGPNMQQILPDGQFGFLYAAEAISRKAYSLVDPRNVYTLLREALAKTREPGASGPVNLFLPMNLQAAEHEYNLDRLLRPVPRLAGGLRPNAAEIGRAAQAILRHSRIVMRVGADAQQPGTYTADGFAITAADHAWIRIHADRVEAWGDVRALTLRTAATRLEVHGAVVPATADNGTLRWSR